MKHMNTLIHKHTVTAAIVRNRMATVRTPKANPLLLTLMMMMKQSQLKVLLPPIMKTAKANQNKNHDN
jgi:hypothetical protein